MTGAGLAHRAVEDAEPAALALIQEAVRMPSFSDTGVGIRPMAEWFTELLATICPDARLEETDGNPIVFGTVAGARDDAPSVIIYGLYDVTPTSDDRWVVDPLGAEIVNPDLLGLPGRVGPVLIGRGVHNHKGPVISMIRAIRAIRDAGASLPVRLIFVIEGEEEIGSPSLGGFVGAHADQLADVAGIWLPCMQQGGGDTMTLRRGFKGSLFFQLSCRGGEWGGPVGGHVWAGNSAWIDAPLMQLVRALGTLYDDDQRVTIDGVFEEVAGFQRSWAEESSSIAASLRDDPAWASGVLNAVRAQQAMAGKDLVDHLEHYLTGVTLNLQGISGGYQGPTFYTMMPAEATARLDLRFPPGPAPERMVELIRDHLDRRGFGHVQVELARGYPGSAPLPSGTDQLLVAAEAAAARSGVSTSVWPIANNCCPSALFTGLGPATPFSIAGLGRGGGDHAPNEWIATDAIGALMHFTVDFLAEIAGPGGMA